MRFYFYRQTITNSKDVNEIRCITNQKPNHYSATDYYCLPSTAGYWGRDHLSNEGIPPDGLKRTAWGLYPAGGQYDNDNGKPVALVAGAAGAGLHPMLMSSFTDSQVAAFVLSFVICLILFYGISQLAQLPFMGDFGYTFNQLGLDYQYNALGKGLLDSRNIIYFFSVIFLALLITKLRISTLK